MTLETFLIVLAVVLFGGMFLGLFLSYRDIEAKRSAAASRAEVLEMRNFYGWSAKKGALADHLKVRQIEHHLRREALIAEQFVSDPSPRTLRAYGGSRLGAN